MYGLPEGTMYAATVIEKGMLGDQLANLNDIIQHGEYGDPPRLVDHKTVEGDDAVLMCEVEVLPGLQGIVAFLASDVL